MSVRSKRQNSFCNMFPSACLSPYPHFHKHIQAQTRYPNAVQFTHKSCSPPLTSFQMSEQSRIDILTVVRTHKYYEIKHQGSNMTGPSGSSFSYLHKPRSTAALFADFHSMKSEVKFSTFGFSRTLQLTVTSPFSVATNAGVLPCRANKP